jgi:mono/diheme cytochrome c family protein
MKIFLTVVITLVVLVVIGLAFMYSGIYNVAAINPPGPFETWFFSTISDNSVEHHSSGIKPPPLDDAGFVDSGFVQFNRRCVGCHGAPGVKPGVFSRGMNPEPPDLAESLSDQSDAEIYWVVYNGIKMTAMPSFGKSHTELQIWQIVSFARLLPKITAEQYQEYRSRLGQAGHQ